VHRSLPAIAIAVLATTGSANADNSTWHFTLTGDVAATDNVFSVPSNEDPQADIFVQVRPGVLWAYNAPRTIQELSAQVEVLEYVFHSSEPSLNAYGGWKGFFLPGPRSEALITLDGSTGQLNALTTRSSADAPPPGLVPDGTAPISVDQADASEYLSWIPARDWRLYETGLAQYAGTDDNEKPPTITYAGLAGLAVGIERDFRADSLSLELGGQWVYLERLAPPDSPPGAGSLLSRQLNPRGLVLWRHDIGKHWSTNLTAGVVYLNPYAHDTLDSMDLNKPQYYPTGTALVAYTQPWGRATLTAAHVIAPNLLVAENVMDDSVVAQVALPLPWLDDNPHLRTPKLAGLGMVTLERTELLDASSSADEGRFDIFRIGLGVSYTPQPGRTFGLRYEFIYQHPTNAIGALLEPNFFRDTLFFTFDLRFPDRVAAVVPRINDSVRADRKDLSPVGAEPVVPDPLEPVGEDTGIDQ
jgi:hypothetical protein